MRDIHHKIITKRVAIANASLHMKKESLEAIKNNSGPKKDILATSRAAAYLAVKNTAATIPHCHPLPVEAVSVEFEFLEEQLNITLKATTIYKTGCEIEAMHGASVCALTIYDMMKPVDKDIEIHSIRLVKKSGGKTDRIKIPDREIRAAVVCCSDSVFAGKKEDKSGTIISSKLENINVTVTEKIIIPDERAPIQNTLNTLCEKGVDLLIFTGGTGLSPRDITPESVLPLLDREIPGIMEAARSYGQHRTPLAMLSRGIAGMKEKTLVICLPGSSSGAAESMDAIFPSALHIFKVLDIGYKHQDQWNQ